MPRLQAPSLDCVNGALLPAQVARGPRCPRGRELNPRGRRDAAPELSGGVRRLLVPHGFHLIAIRDRHRTPRLNPRFPDGSNPGRSPLPALNSLLRIADIRSRWSAPCSPPSLRHLKRRLAGSTPSPTRRVCVSKQCCLVEPVSPKSVGRADSPARWQDVPLSFHATAAPSLTIRTAPRSGSRSRPVCAASHPVLLSCT